MNLLSVHLAGTGTDGALTDGYSDLWREHTWEGGLKMNLRDTDAVANLAVKDLKRAKSFYEGTLGLEPVDAEGDELIVYRSGSTTLNVYRSQEAGTNRATAVTWDVGDEVGDVVEALKRKGVHFEHYDMPGLKLEGDIHVGDGLKVAWFKDPDGNILNLVSG